MKVGILTFDDTTNYGAALQAYALNRKINDLGYDCETIKYRCENIQKREAPKRFFEVKGIKAKISWFLTSHGARRKHELITNFLRTRIKQSHEIYDKTTIASAETFYDKFVVGSDIVWETNVTGHDYTYYLDFVSSPNKKTSYAASFGYDDIPANEKEIVREYLKTFCALAVREEQGQRIIHGLLPGEKACLTCDPTLLLSREEWKSLLPEESMFEKDSYVFVYFTDKQGRLLQAAKKYAKEHGKEVVLYNVSARSVKGVKNICNVSVEDFLSIIQNSSMVFTGSYHGVCFSLIFHIPFVFLNRAHASRILTLVHVLGLERQNLETNEKINDQFDYQKIDERLTNFRDESLHYLENALNL